MENNIMSKSKELDQFYTKKELAIDIYEYLDGTFNLSEYFLIEPSAGEGAFSDLFHKKSISLDIEPKADNVLKKDFLEFDFLFLDEKDKVFTIGNPPFGKNSSTAVKFFNKSAEHSDFIAFIVPKTFKKVSIQNKLNLDFKLFSELPLPENSFLHDGEQYDVPCVLQVWKKDLPPRKKVNTNIKSKYFEFTSKADGEFAIRRVGGLAGKVILDFEDYQESSHYYIKSKIDIEDLIDALESGFQFLNNAASNSAGNPSLSKYELITLLNFILEED